MTGPREGISPSLYASVLFYSALVVVHSDSLLSAVFGYVSIFLIQMAVLALRPILRKLPPIHISFAVTAITLVVGIAFRSGATLLLGPTLNGSSPFFPDPVYLLVSVPLLAKEVCEPETFGGKNIFRSLLALLPFWLVCATLRELFGFGSIAGVLILPGEENILPVLTHTSGSAFLVLILLVLILFLARQIKGKNFVLENREETFHPQPILDRESERSRLGRAIRLFFIGLFLLVLVYSIYLFFLPISFDVFLFILLALLLPFQFFLPRILKIDSSDSERFYLVPVAVFILAMPAAANLDEFIQAKGLLPALGAILLYYVVIFACVTFLLLFFRVVRRRMMFGKRQDLLSGIPFGLLIAALLLLILSGFGTIPASLLPSIAGG